MTDFFYICKHLVGTQDSKGKESADPGCTKKFNAGSHCRQIMGRRPGNQSSTVLAQIF